MKKAIKEDKNEKRFVDQIETMLDEFLNESQEIIEINNDRNELDEMEKQFLNLQIKNEEFDNNFNQFVERKTYDENFIPKKANTAKDVLPSK